MVSGLFTDTVEVSNKGRQQKQSGRILKYLSRTQCGVTIPEIAEHVRISVPTTTKLINELIKLNCINEVGKRETDNGRKPTLYSLNKERFYAVGVEVVRKRIQVKVVRVDKEVIFEKRDDAFLLENSKECLGYVIDFIKDTINGCGIASYQIMGVGIGITGRVDCNTGQTLNYFNFLDVTFAEFVEKSTGLPTIVDNDTRILGIAEQVVGKARSVNNALVVNLSRGLGISLILNKKVIAGGNGFAGELGHMQLGYSDRLCLCGKQGCMETVVSGHALEEDLKEALLNGEQSIFFNNNDDSNYRYDEVLEAALKGDALSIRLIQKQGDCLGEALGNLLNLLNPEVIIIGGKMARAGDLFTTSVKMGIKKTALINPLMFCKVRLSELENEAVPNGAAYMVWKKYEMI
ncbi:MAG: ROK family transcriptional regulator [Bacteroidales bacterium]|nr:ROK family transcriptional regulator [Bacteroidales bacterium]